MIHRQRLRVSDIQHCAQQMAVGYHIRKCIGINQCAATHVDEDSLRFHSHQPFTVQQMNGFRCMGQATDNNICLCQQRIQGMHASHGIKAFRKITYRAPDACYRSTKGLHAPGNVFSNVTGTEDQHFTAFYGAFWAAVLPDSQLLLFPIGGKMPEQGQNTGKCIFCNDGTKGAGSSGQCDLFGKTGETGIHICSGTGHLYPLQSGAVLQHGDSRLTDDNLCGFDVRQGRMFIVNKVAAALSGLFKHFSVLLSTGCHNQNLFHMQPPFIAYSIFFIVSHMEQTHNVKKREERGGLHWEQKCSTMNQYEKGWNMVF